jgi:DNA-binding CsgD family transcriptional regulator
MAPEAQSVGGAPGPPDPLAPHSATPAELQALLQAERAGGAFLVARDAGGLLKLFPLDPGVERIAIGRHPAAGVPITWDNEVSSLHAELDCLGGEWTLSDDGLSRNGTYVNEQRLHGRRRLRDEDRVRVGQTVLAVSLGSALTVEHTAIGTNDAAKYDLSPAQRRVLVELCRPCRASGSFAAPASNQQIADALFLSVETVKMHLRALFAKFDLDGVPQNQKRARLAEAALNYGVITPAELD